jgi:hypothetical protein
MEINSLLPTTGLFQLSQSNFDSQKLGLRMNIIHNSLRIGLVNIPYMLLQIHFLKIAKREIPIFLLKNPLLIFVCIRQIISYQMSMNCENRLKFLIIVIIITII